MLKVKDQLRKLNKRDLTHLRDYIDALMADHEEAEESAAEKSGPQDSGKGSGKGKGGKGWVEVKMIGENGPYAYQRWYEGKRKKSKYLGKVQGSAG